MAITKNCVYSLRTIDDAILCWQNTVANGKSSPEKLIEKLEALAKEIVQLKGFRKIASFWRLVGNVVINVYYTWTLIERYIYTATSLDSISRIGPTLFDEKKLYDRLAKAIMDKVDSSDMYKNTQNVPHLRLVLWFDYCVENTIF